MPKIEGGQMAVGASASPLSSDPSLKVETLILKAPDSNTAPVYFGVSGVTTSTGYPLSAGEQYQILPGNGALGLMPKPNEIYVVGTSGTLAWVAYR